MPSCHCLYPNYVPWVYETFSDCIYTTTDQVAFYFGLSSMAFWLICQLPQFIKNCRRKSAEALSLCFLIEWLGGDILNFAGSVLTGMLPTQVWLAGWFVVMDVFILGQYIYLFLLNRGRPKSAAVLDSDSDAEITEPLTAGAGAGAGDGGSGAGRGGKRSGGAHGAINAATAQYGTTATTLASRTAATETGSAAAEAASATAPAPRRGASVLPRGAGRSVTAVTGSSGDRATAKAPARRAATAAAATSAAGDENDEPPRGHASLTCGRGAPAISALSVACVAICVALPAATRPDGYWSGTGSAVHAGSTVRRSAGWHVAQGVMSAVGVADSSFGSREVLYAGSADSSFSAVSGESQARRLEIHSCISNTNTTAEDRTLSVVGDVFGWVSSALYLTSRLPQVYKNYQRGSVEGLSWLMFLCAFLGNSTALIGILPRMSTQEDWESEAPFLPGMMGTIVLDFTIMFQWFWYTARATRRRAERKQLREAAKRAAGGGRTGGGADGGVLGAPTGAEAALLLDTPDLISANARRGLYDMVESPPPPRTLPAPVEV